MSEELTHDELVSDMDFNDTSVKTLDVSFWKGQSGVTDRLGVVSEKVKRSMVHYRPGVGYILCRSIPAQKDASGKIIKGSEKALCCKKLGQAKLRCGVVVVQYRTDKTGSLKEPFSYETRVWLFGEDKYVQLRSCNEEFPLSDNDIKVTCVDDKYQKVQVIPAKDSFWKKEKLGWFQEIRDEVAATEAKLPRLMGKLLSDEEILQIVGASPADGEIHNVVGNDQDLDAVLGDI